MAPFSLQGKQALVTGASRGIGYAAAAALAEAGSRVHLVARSGAQLQTAVDRLSGSPKASFSVFDLLEVDRIASWFAEKAEISGGFDILVNAAGITHRAPAVDFPVEPWKNIMELNVRAAFELSRAFARDRFQRGGGGAIVNVASLATRLARPNIAAYIASKGALGQLTKALAIEWAGHGIRVNAIAPGYVETEMTRPLKADPKFDEWVAGRCPLGRWAQPEEIAWPIVFLASPAAAYVTGQIVYVDGGWSAAL